MLTCPVCGWEMRRGEIRRDGFACPGCKERLLLSDPGWAIFVVVWGAYVLALLIPTEAGVRGYRLFLYAIIIYVLMIFVSTVLRVSLFPPKLERDFSQDVGGVLHLSDRPNSSQK